MRALVMEKAARLRGFLGHDIWAVRTRALPVPRRIPLKILKIVLLASRGYAKDRLGLRASALTLYSMLSIVPVLALLFGIAKGFGLQGHFEAWILEQFPEQQDVLTRMVEFARRALENTAGGLVAGAGVAFLLYSVIKVIGHIEQAMNHIWSVAKPRSFSRKFSDYLSLILVGPFLVLGASSLNVYIESLVHRAAAAAPFTGVLAPLARLSLQAIPILMLWLLFSFTYVFMPNTKVRIASGLIGGAVAALLYQAAQSFYIQVQVGLSSNNAVYGSFAALPLFIIWLQLSWHIVLLGAELTQQHQNFDANELDEKMPNLSFRAVKRLALAVCAEAAGRFARGEPAPTADELGNGLGIPSRVLGDLLQRLEDAGMLVELAPGPAQEPRWQPARDPRLLTPAAVAEALENLGEDLEAPREKNAPDRSARVLAALERRLRETRPAGKRGSRPEAEKPFLRPGGSLSSKPAEDLRGAKEPPMKENHAFEGTREAADAAAACAQACRRCAAACLDEEDIASLRDCIRLDRDCAWICDLASAYLLAGSAFQAEACRLCADVCEACAAECDKHEAMAHCRECAEACRRCAEACRALSEAMA